MLIVVATHQKPSVIHNSVIQGIHIGYENAVQKINDSYLRDNKGDNISFKNENYCELTALYWLWKNCSDQDIVGLMHYRRYLYPFSNIFLRSNKKRIIQIDKNDWKIKRLANAERFQNRVKSLLQDYDVVLPILADYSHKGKFPSLYADYREHHIEQHWLVMEQVLLEKYPEYKPSIRDVFHDNCLIYGTNMFIARYEWMSEYCEWLFDILFEVEKRIQIPQDSYQKRVFGFMSERLLTLYVIYHSFKVFESKILLYK